MKSSDPKRTSNFENREELLSYISSLKDRLVVSVHKHDKALYKGRMLNVHYEGDAPAAFVIDAEEGHTTLKAEEIKDYDVDSDTIILY